VNVLYRKQLAAAADPAGLRSELINEYTRRLVQPYHAAEHGFVDDLIDPMWTRSVVARGLAMLREKRLPPPRRKHGNIPL
jgi:acetyl-CoA carboxylase carboxyltransferase component